MFTSPPFLGYQIILLRVSLFFSFQASLLGGAAAASSSSSSLPIGSLFFCPPATSQSEAILLCIYYIAQILDRATFHKVCDGQEGQPGQAKPSLGLRAPPAAPLPSERPPGPPGVCISAALSGPSVTWLGAWPDLIFLLVPQIVQKCNKNDSR